MASPQKENGHTEIAHEILEALAQTPINGYEARYLFALFRKTYGFQKKEDRISNSQFVKITNLRKGHISRTEHRLIKRKIVTKIGNSTGFQKDYDEWLDRDGVTKIGIKVTKIGHKVTKNGGHNRYYTINTIQNSAAAEISTQTKTTTATPDELTTRLIVAAEHARGHPFIRRSIQRKYILAMFTSGKTYAQIGRRWLKLHRSDFYKDKGVDFNTVLKDFDRDHVR